MKITRVSPVSLKTETLDLDITQDQIDAYENGELIQDAFPNLSEDEREFYMNGFLPGEYDSLFAEDDEDDEEDGEYHPIYNDDEPAF